MFVFTSKAYIFPLQSDDILKCDTRSSILPRKSYICTKSGPSYACSFSVPLYVTVKTFVIILYVVIPSVLVVVKFKVLVNLHTLLLVHLIVS